jgi:hypothetical protein
MNLAAYSILAGLYSAIVNFMFSSSYTEIIITRRLQSATGIKWHDRLTGVKLFLAASNPLGQTDMRMV